MFCILQITQDQSNILNSQQNTTSKGSAHEGEALKNSQSHAESRGLLAAAEEDAFGTEAGGAEDLPALTDGREIYILEPANTACIPLATIMQRSSRRLRAGSAGPSCSSADE